MRKIIHYLNIKAPVEKVYGAVATIEGLSNWWSTKVGGDVKEGGIINFTFIEVFNPNMKITSLKKPSALGTKLITVNSASFGAIRRCPFLT